MTNTVNGHEGLQCYVNGRLGPLAESVAINIVFGLFFFFPLRSGSHD